MNPSLKISSLKIENLPAAGWENMQKQIDDDALKVVAFENFTQR